MVGDQALNTISKTDGYTALHHAVDMGAHRTLQRLLAEPAIDRGACDKKGRTAADLAKENGLPHILSMGFSLILISATSSSSLEALRSESIQ